MRERIHLIEPRLPAGRAGGELVLLLAELDSQASLGVSAGCGEPNTAPEYLQAVGQAVGQWPARRWSNS